MNKSPYSYYLPAEWEPQSGIQLTWAHENTDWNPYLDEIEKCLIQLTATISNYEKVVIVAQHPDKVAAILSDKLSSKQFANVIIHACNTNDTWARDHGAITLMPRKHLKDESLQPQVLDFRFNGWGNKFAANYDNAITADMYDKKLLCGTYVNYLDFILEGGAIESDGKGTIFTTSQCLLAPQRNQPLTQAEIEDLLKQRLCAQRIVWLDHGNLIGDDTDGHIDTIVRIAPNDTLLYVGCDDTEDEQYEDFKKLEEQLKQLRTADNQPYKLLRLPMPQAIYYDEERLPATYANFVIINGAVIVPTYQQPQNDEKAMQVIQEAFPQHQIIGIDAGVVIRQHGSLHCLTMQYPHTLLRTNDK